MNGSGDTAVAVQLPNEDGSPCRAFAASLEVDPGGSALRVDQLVLIETPLPWPKPVGNHPLLESVMPLMRGASVPTRILATEPSASDGDEATVDGVRVVVFRRFDEENGGAPLVSRTTWVRNAEALHALVGDLVAGVDPTTLSPESHSEATGRAVLVCTQGSHDICCGEQGPLLLSEFDSASEDTTTPEVFRVSHLGGHRFAPTALTLPDCRMWGFLDAGELLAITNRRGSPADVAQKCRGWLGAGSGAAQMAERAVFATQSWEWDRAPRSIDVERVLPESTNASPSWSVAVRSGDQTWRVEVEVRRSIPVIACMEAGGMPTKPGREYGVRTVTHVV